MKEKIIIFLLFMTLKISAQGENKWQFNGYVSLMGSFKKEMSDSLFIPTGENKHKDALLHNRLNFFWYPAQSFTFSVQMRNRFIFDETISDMPGIDENYEKDLGFMQLSKNLYSKDDYLLNISVDRLYFQYTKGNLEVKIGRQRVNWSQCFAWNPNDIFNASNYFDFDYPEKPGSDAIRLLYYTGMASSAEAVIKIDNEKNITAAGLYKLNLKGYDLQVLSGIMNEEEFVLGTGWSGNIRQIGFRGEVTSVLPYKDTSEYMHNMDNLLLSALSFDYTFSNSASIMCEFLYSNNDLKALSSSFSSVFSGPVTIRNLAFSRLSSLLSVSYPVHPLVNVTLSGMYFYKISGFYTGPNVDFSVTDNINLSVYWQYFKMYLSKEKQIQLSDISINYIFFRLKYNF